MPLIVYLDSLLFMSELFGFVNSRHFCHTEDVKNNRSSGLNILDMEPLKYLPGLNAQHKKTQDYGRKGARKTVYPATSHACTKILPTALGRQGAAQLAKQSFKEVCTRFYFAVFGLAVGAGAKGTSTGFRLIGQPKRVCYSSKEILSKE